MKNKIISLILVLMLLPIASLFGACGNDDGYDLDALEKDFNTMAVENNNIKSVEGKFVFDYSGHEDLQTIISSISPYKELEKYNYIFDNLMSFAYEYVPACANNQLTQNANIKNRVKSDLIELKKAVSDVNKSTNMFAERVLIAEDGEIKSDVCLIGYEGLLKSYENMFEKATNFNNSLADLYFNYGLKQGNPDVYSVKLIEFNSSVVVSKLRSRIKYQISCLSQNFVEMYVDGVLAEEIAKATGGTTLDLNQFNYKQNVEAINKAFNETVAIEKANNSINKDKFYDLSVQAQNIQTAIQNDMSKFVVACGKIEYAALDSATATAYEKTCAEIIESNYDLICEYNRVLSQMLIIIAD